MGVTAVKWLPYLITGRNIMAVTHSGIYSYKKSADSTGKPIPSKIILPVKKFHKAWVNRDLIKPNECRKRAYRNFVSHRQTSYHWQTWHLNKNKYKYWQQFNAVILKVKCSVCRTWNNSEGLLKVTTNMRQRFVLLFKVTLLSRLM